MCRHVSRSAGPWGTWGSAGSLQPWPFRGQHSNTRSSGPAPQQSSLVSGPASASRVHASRGTGPRPAGTWALAASSLPTPTSVHPCSGGVRVPATGTPQKAGSGAPSPPCPCHLRGKPSSDEHSMPVAGDGPALQGLLPPGDSQVHPRVARGAGWGSAGDRVTQPGTPRPHTLCAHSTVSMR